MAEEQNINNPQNSSETDLPEVQKELSKISLGFSKSIAILIVICGIFAYIFFQLFFGSKKSNSEDYLPPVNNIAKPAQDDQDNVPEIPKLPEPPKLEVPTAPPPPPITVAPPVLPTPVEDNKSKALLPPPISLPSAPSNLVDSDAEKQRREAKRKSSIVLIGGTEVKKTPDQITQEATFKDRGDMTFVLGRGKIIDAVLETAINSDFGGEIKAMVSRDVFSEQGKVILIPKGSKIFGTYGTSTETYGRISVIWNRIDLTNGYTIEFDSLAVDGLGRKGMQGRVDNKFKERFANSILQSAFNIAFANALDKVVTPPINSQAAAANSAVATQIQNIAQSNAANTTVTEDVRIVMICTSVLGAITDTTSAAYSSMTQSCLTAQNPSTANTAAQRLAALVQAVNSAAASLLTTAATASTPTQAQQASTQAFTDVTNTVKAMIAQQEFKPTTTIDQGTAIKIFVNKDYKFPKAVLLKSRLMK
ncbi:TrbI/VirB10 family protein [Rickettsia endosymbiont of Halotydeus destructor]|uniref:TrbI/VirB10 family protein n=1 Tax=Rickettsia endosymbiont of Halotydeus destructor TaxID=2996754 RepID=UPI003BAE891F